MIQTWSDADTITRLTFISDLHLFSSRSNADQHRGLISAAIDAADLCVWGGDLFDFRWSRLRTEQESVARALTWLDDWYEQFSTTQFVYLDGNHDAHRLFADQLADWSSQRNRFTSGIDCLRIRSILLLHGDVIEGRGSHDRFTRYRQRWQEKPVASITANRIYDAAIASRAHRAAAAAAHQNRRTCLKLLHWMHGQPDQDTDGIEQVVFGHTHRKLDSYLVDGIRFHNGGAAIQHVPFSPVNLEVP